MSVALGLPSPAVSSLCFLPAPRAPMSSFPLAVLSMAPTPCIPSSNLRSSPLPPPLPSTLDAPSTQSPSHSDPEPLVDSDSTGSPNSTALPDVDPQIVEALKSKDRIYVLKLGEQMESLINDRRFVFFLCFPLQHCGAAVSLHRETSHICVPSHFIVPPVFGPSQ